MSGVVVVTGADGFVGRPLCERLATQGWCVRRALRRFTGSPRTGDYAIGDIGGNGANPGWHAVLEGADAVVHLAARTHVLHDEAADPLAAYRRVNVDGTAQLVSACVEAGVQRFVYMSSIKVNGELTHGVPFGENTPPAPQDAYGATKLEAENLLRDSGLSVTVLRPPLVYGPGVKANFLRLMRAVAMRWPLPLASLRNRRSLIYIDNLVDVTALCLTHPQAAGQTFLVRDAEQPSTAELVRCLGEALGVNARLMAFPPVILGCAATLLGRRAEWQRLAGSLEIDSRAVNRCLGWTPPHPMAAGLAATARWYHQEYSGKSIR